MICTNNRLKCQDSPELDVETKLKNDKSLFTKSWSRHIQSFSGMLFGLVDGNLAKDYDCKSSNSSAYKLIYLEFCNVLHACNVHAIPTYKVYQL